MRKLVAIVVGCAACLVLRGVPARAQQADGPDAEEPTGEEPSGEEAPGGETEEGAPEEGAPEEGPAEETPPAMEEDCEDGQDDDGDGTVDCEDEDCEDDEACDFSADEPVTPPTPPEGGTEEGEEGTEGGDLLDVEEEPAAGDEWEDESLDVFELHGYMRVRGDLFHNLQIYRVKDGPPYDSPDFSGFANHYPYRPIDNASGVACSRDEGCDFSNSTFAGANMRFRLSPVINVSEDVRILAQIDLLDNLVLGSTPEGTYFEGTGGAPAAVSGWAPLRFFSTTQVAPSWRNSLTNAVNVRRVWAEVMTPLGQLRFGRMGNNWGLGMMANDGNGIDSDFGDTVDRICFAARVFGVYIIPGMDFGSQGPTTQLWDDMQGQPMDASQLDDVTEYFLIVARQLERAEQEERMRRGDLVLNGGLYFTFRNQVLSQERYSLRDFRADPEEGETSPWTLRNAWALIPDVWMQIYYRGFHAELEFVYVGGQIENTTPEGYRTDEEGDVRAYGGESEIRQIGGVARIDYTMLHNQLNFGLEFGYASGDAEVEGLTARQTHGPLVQQAGYEGSRVGSLFAFDPDFNVDLILFEQVLGQVAGVYYLRPWVSYEFIRNRVGARADFIYSIAAEPMQTIGNDPNLGVELDVSVWYRSPDNFYGLLQYGVLFPLDAWKDPFYEPFDGVEYPQTVQVLLGVTY